MCERQEGLEEPACPAIESMEEEMEPLQGLLVGRDPSTALMNEEWMQNVLFNPSAPFLGLRLYRSYIPSGIDWHDDADARPSPPPSLTLPSELWSLIWHHLADPGDQKALAMSCRRLLRHLDVVAWRVHAEVRRRWMALLLRWAHQVLQPGIPFWMALLLSDEAVLDRARVLDSMLKVQLAALFAALPSHPSVVKLDVLVRLQHGLQYAIRQMLLSSFLMQRPSLLAIFADIKGLVRAAEATDELEIGPESDAQLPSPLWTRKLKYHDIICLREIFRATPYQHFVSALLDNSCFLTRQPSVSLQDFEDLARLLSHCICVRLRDRHVFLASHLHDTS